jgi:hypothetical protein
MCVCVCVQGRVENVLWLLDHAVPVDAADGAGATALHWAVGYGQISVINALLEAGASALAVDRLKRDLLFWAAHSDRLDGEMPQVGARVCARVRVRDGGWVQGQGVPRHPERNTVVELLKNAAVRARTCARAWVCTRLCPRARSPRAAVGWQAAEKARGHPLVRAGGPSTQSTAAPLKQPTKKAAECDDPPCERALPRPGAAVKARHIRPLCFVCLQPSRRRPSRASASAWMRAS